MNEKIRKLLINNGYNLTTTLENLWLNPQTSIGFTEEFLQNVPDHIILKNIQEIEKRCQEAIKNKSGMVKRLPIFYADNDNCVIEHNIGERRSRKEFLKVGNTGITSEIIPSLYEQTKDRGMKDV